MVIGTNKRSRLTVSTRLSSDFSKHEHKRNIQYPLRIEGRFGPFHVSQMGNRLKLMNGRLWSCDLAIGCNVRSWRVDMLRLFRPDSRLEIGRIRSKYPIVIVFPNMSIYEIFNSPSNRGRKGPVRVSHMLPCMKYTYNNFYDSIRNALITATVDKYCFCSSPVQKKGFLNSSQNDGYHPWVS